MAGEKIFAFLERVQKKLAKQYVKEGPPPPPIVDADEALSLVLSYLDDIYNTRDLSQTERFAALKHATRYLNQARAINPNAMIARTIGNVTGTVTIDQLSAELLCLEAGSNAAYDIPKAQKDAIAIYEKALVYTPDAPHIYRHITECYLRLNRRKEALAAARTALQLEPKNIENRKLVDKIESTPGLGVKRRERSSALSVVGTLFIILGTIAIVIAPIIAYNMQIYPAMIGWPIVGIPIFWLGTKLADWGMSRDLVRRELDRDRFTR